MRRIVLTLGALALIASACSSTEEQFKDSLIDQGFTEEQANCTVEKLEEAGINPEDVTDEALGDDPVPPEAIRATVECLAGEDVADLVDDVDLSGIDSDTLTSDANTFGDNPDLDAMWTACEGGSAQACDDLYLQSPVGSEYEAFGNTCGNRTDGTAFCVDAMDG